MPFAETVVKGPAGSLMNRWSSRRIVRECSEHRCKGFRRVSGVHPVLEGALLRTVLGAGSESRRRSGYELELRLRRGPPNRSGSRLNRSGRRRSAGARHRLRMRRGRRKRPAPAGPPTPGGGCREEHDTCNPTYYDVSCAVFLAKVFLSVRFGRFTRGRLSCIDENVKL